MKRVLRWYDYLTINIYWFALTVRAQALAPLVIPLLVQRFVGEGAKGTYVGIIRLWALMVALLVQALMGMLSDRSSARWGRRRPFIVVGALGEVAVFVAIGAIAGLEGMTGFWLLFALYILSMVSSNAAHAATQGLIPDLVPEENRGLASGVKALLELPAPLILVSLVIGRLVAAGNLWGGLYVVIGVILICMAIALLVPEQPQPRPQAPLDWRPFLRLLAMTAAFTAIILGTGEVVKVAVSAARGLAPQAALLLVGAVGLAGMALAASLGVWLSLRIGLGERGERSRAFTWWVVNRLAFLVASTNLAGFMVYFLQEKFPQLQGVRAAGPAASLVMVVGVLVLLTALPGGRLADRLGKKPLIGASALMAAAGTLLAILAQGMAPLYVGSALIGMGVGLFYSANWALGTELVPREKAGQFLGLSNLAGAGAGAVGAYIGGPIADHMGYVLLMGIYGALFLLSLLPLLRVPEERRPAAVAAT